MGLLTLPALALLTLLAAWAVSFSLFWLFALIPLAALLVLGVYDVAQRRRSILRNFPVLGHVRFMMEYIRPEVQQYFIERNTDGRPFDRDTRTVIYERAKGIHGDQAFGTELEVEASGYEFLRHSMAPLQPTPEQPRVVVGGPDCTQPYPIALLNVSAMSFGALSAHAILALNKGAKAGAFAHDTGEGGISPYHRQGGGDLVWELGSGYFGARTPDGDARSAWRRRTRSGTGHWTSPTNPCGCSGSRPRRSPRRSSSSPPWASPGRTSCGRTWCTGA